MLPQAHRIRNSPSFGDPLAARDPKNPNAPGLAKSKNGPGPGGKQQGPPVVTTSSEELSSTTTQTSPSETQIPSLDNPSPTPPSSLVPPFTSPTLLTTSSSTSSPTLLTTSVSASSPTLIATSSSTTSLDLASSSVLISVVPTSVIPTLSTNFKTPFITAKPPERPSIKTDVSSGADGFSTSAINLVSGSLPSTLSTVLYPGETTLRTSFTYTSSPNAIETGMVTSAPKSAISSGQKSGIAVGTLAGFVVILTMLFLIFRWRRGESPKALQCSPRHLLGTQGNFRWLSRKQTHNAMSDSLLTPEAGLGGTPTWDYNSTFALPSITEKPTWSLRKSLTTLRRFDPLGLNPVLSQDTGARPSSQISFASFFRQLPEPSTPQSPFCPSFLPGRPGVVVDTQSPPLPCASFLLPQPGRPREIARIETDGSPPPWTMPPQVPPHALQYPWHHRNSQISVASDKSGACSFKFVPGWVKPRYSYESDSGEGPPREPGKALPPFRVSPGSWLKTKALRRSHPTTVY